MPYSNLSKTIALCIGVLLMVFLTGYFVFAWTDPYLSPPRGNTDAPLNVSRIGQAKSGSLILNKDGTAVSYGLVVLGKTVDEVSPGVCPTGYDWWGLNAEKCQKTPLYVKNDGSVGIGTTVLDPEYLLTVNGTIAGTGHVNTAIPDKLPTISDPEFQKWYKNDSGRTKFVSIFIYCPPNHWCGSYAFLSEDQIIHRGVFQALVAADLVPQEGVNSSHTIHIIVPNGWSYKIAKHLHSEEDPQIMQIVEQPL